MKIKRYTAQNPFGTNVYLVWDEESKKAFLVDPGSPLDEAVQLIEKENLELDYIILTHAHGDHTGGLSYFREKYPEAKLVAGAHEKKMLMNRDISYGDGGIKADINVKDGDTLTVGTMDLKFIECPGHTPGGISILVDNVLFSGDTLFRRSVGRTDLPGGDWEALLSTLKEKLFVLPDETLVLPGHMEETTIGYEKRYNPFV